MDEALSSGSDDERLMALACRLALRGKGKTRPNPLVGAVLVKDGGLIGTGYHKGPGLPHAEVIAIRNATERPEGSTLYVNLEPCAHFGRTPPCVDLILASSIRRVVIGTLDPNPKVNGKSMGMLRDHGVEVTCGVREAACRRLNEVFFKFIETSSPFVTLKAAVSLDGKIASWSGRSKWISCEASRKRVHRLRSEADAILVGIGTVLQDDPALTVRGVPGRAKPLRVVLDSRLRIPLEARVLGPEAPTLVATTEQAPAEKVRLLRDRGIGVEVFAPDRKGRVPLAALLSRLGQREVQHLLIEGGGEVHTAALEEKVADKLMLFVAPLLLGGREAPSFFSGQGADDPARAYAVREMRALKSDRDILLEGYLGPVPTRPIREAVSGCPGVRQAKP
ncbi:MAG: bifunctional diaminohydroxyphosphoribosylaminopyrimidine deaminase/5-amino-6-(5-phosphoribosylamino)uracil reductase RibD [bacterium]